ncbi:MAG TPA: GldG family protein [Ardenticatenaceae bacterium]|nr:GldG family protein [Ardenticatenaceae bacterium]
MAVGERGRAPGRFDATTSAGRAARYGSNALVMTLAFVGILVLLNVVAGRVAKRWDLTAEGRFSLAPQSRQILAGLREPVTVTGFFPQGDPSQAQAEDLLKEYQLAGNGRLTYRFVDPELQPGLARQLGITSYPSIVFQQGDRTQTVFAPDEQSFTSAILKVSSDQPSTIFFLTGHGEAGPEDFSDRGASTWREALERDNYRVATLNLAISDTVPSEAAVLVVAGPRAPLAANEIESLRSWVDGGGSMLVLAGPDTDPSLGSVLEAWGVSLGEGVVVDPSASFFGDIATPLVASYPFHQITRDLGGLTSIFPFARPITSQAPGAQPLVTTSAESWAETNLENQQVEFNPDRDAQGPLTLALAVDPSAGQAEPPVEGAAGASAEAQAGRLVVFGNTDFIANRVFSMVQGSLGNLDLAVNAVNWLAADEALIALRTDPGVQRQIVLTGGQGRAIFYGTTLGLPLLVLLAGGWVWWRRR